jgi:acyl carrier protein
MTVQEIEQLLIQGISSIKNLDVAEIAPERSFHDMGIDSLGFVEILVYIEKTLHLPLMASDLTKEDFENVRRLALFISRKQ